MKRLILNPITIAALLVMFLVSAPEMNFSKSGLGLVENAEAKGKDKDDDKGKDDDEVPFIYDQANTSDLTNTDLTTTYDCSNIENIQIIYHEDFIASEDADGPNVKVTGSDSTTCTVVIKKVSGGTDCGHRIDFTDNALMLIETDVINDATNCEVCIEATVPSATTIKG
jgi:hypothetical protein